MAVSVSAALRWYLLLTSMHTLAVRDGQAKDANPGNFSGPNLSELIVPWRYRVRTA